MRSAAKAIVPGGEAANSELTRYAALSARTQTAHLVIGGGLAGSMAAVRLATAGREVTLLERERSPHHKVCGEFLSREAVDYLADAGIDPLALGAQTIRSVRLTSRGRVIETRLPFTALSLSRATLDEAMLTRAAQAGCSVQRGAFVEGLTPRNGEWHAQLRGGDSCSSEAVFLASGKHDVRGLERKLGRTGTWSASSCNGASSPRRPRRCATSWSFIYFPAAMADSRWWKAKRRRCAWSCVVLCFAI